MALFLLRRLLSALVLALAVVTAVFLLLRGFGPDPARAALGSMATPEQIHQQAHILGTDRPLLSQYFSWLGDIVRCDLGTSWATSRDVGDVVSAALPITISLALGAMLVSLVVGFAVGLPGRGPARHPRPSAPAPRHHRLRPARLLAGHGARPHLRPSICAGSRRPATPRSKHPSPAGCALSPFRCSACPWA
ncbi:hypothetical protein ACU686_10185 [Yinghuangia aomiensis]